MVVLAKLYEILTPVVEDCGCTLYGIDLIKSTSSTTLRVYVDAKGGVTMDMCALATRRVSATLDAEDVFASRYLLEVSSPGVNRKFFNIEQMIPYIGSMIKVKSSIGIEGRKNFAGELVKVGDSSFSMQIDDSQVEFNFSDVAKANVASTLSA